MTALLLLPACSADWEDEIPPHTAITFQLALENHTRAAQTLNTQAYDAKLYLYEWQERTGGVKGYQQVQETTITQPVMTLGQLTPSHRYKAVFLAIPKGQTPTLPGLMQQSTVPNYQNATAPYLNAQAPQLQAEVFRSIVDFEAGSAASALTTVLTRQNGALEVRIKNQKDLKSVKLQLPGHTAFYLHDGTGGQVITHGLPVILSRTLTDATALSAQEVRLRIHVLPQEDITDATGNQAFLEINTSSGTTKYPLKSDQPRIPIYPNQVTWLTLGNSGTGQFTVGFDSNINLDDPSWDGYFKATFFAQHTHPHTRTAITGSSQRIQSLHCFLYQKQVDGQYTFYTEQPVITYQGTTEHLTPQSHTWPLTRPLSFTLPDGDYKAVFVGNIDPKLFQNQHLPQQTTLEPLLTGYQDGYSSARIHMPQGGPTAFNNYNQFYLCTVDFNQNHPKPEVLMQRMVCSNVYTRNMIDAQEQLNNLVNHVVQDIRQNQLTTDLIKGVLHSRLLDALSRITGLHLAAEALTGLVDHLVNGLLGEVVSKLNEILLQEVLVRLQQSLDGQAGAGQGLLHLGYLLNPWSNTKLADVTFANMTESVDFNRMPRTAYQAQVNWKDIPIKRQANNTHAIELICLNGAEQMAEINVDRNSGYTQLLKPLIGTLDRKALAGLLVNIHEPLGYSMESNLQYKTVYELLDIKLKDYKADAQTAPVRITLPLNSIANLEKLVAGLLGDGIISGLIGALTQNLIQPIIDAVLGTTLEFLDIKLPNLGIGNLQLRGNWDATHVSNGTIAPQLP